MSKQDLQLLNIEVDTFKRADNQLTLDTERKLSRYGRTSELDELRYDDPDPLQLASLIEEGHRIVLTHLLPDKAKSLRALPKGDKAKLNTTEDTRTVAYRYIPAFDISQASGEPVLTVRDFVKDHLTINHENITTLYNEPKDHLDKSINLKVSEKLLTGLDGAKGYSKKDANEVVIGSDEPDS